jgi:hypothetical protein
VLLKFILTYGKGRTWWFLTTNSGCVGRGMGDPGPGEGGLRCPWGRTGITCTHLQLKRRLREREECTPWNVILNHICSKSPELSLSLPCLSWSFFPNSSPFIVMSFYSFFRYKFHM